MVGLLRHFCTLLILSIFLIGPPNYLHSLNYNIQDTLLFVHPIDTLDSLMRYYNSTGLDFLINGNYDLAEENLLKSLEIKQKILSENDRRIGNNHVNLGVLYEKIWKYELAIDHYNKAEEIFKNYDSNYIHIGSIYVNKAIIYRKLRDYEKALDYCNNALIIFNRQKTIDYEKLYITNYNLGIIFEHSGNHKEAIEYFKKSILYDNTKSKSRLLNIYTSLALNYSLIGNLDLAEQYYNVCLDYAKRFLNSNSIQFISIHLNYGTFQLDYLQNLQLSRKLFFSSLENSISAYGEKSTLTAIIYQNVGELFYKLNKLDSALFYFQKSLISEDLIFNDINIYSNPDINLKNQRPRIINTLKFKAKIFDKRYSEDYDINYLKYSLTTYLIIFNYIDIIRLMYESEQSQFIISEQENETYIMGIEVAEKLYRLTNDSTFLNIAFEINEKRIAFSLLTSIRKMEAKEFGGIPPHLLRQENDLYRQMAAYEELIYEERRLTQPDKNRLSIWEERLFKLSQEHDKLINRFELEYPKYYQLKYDVNVKSVTEIINKLNEKEAVIEYSLSDSAVHCFVITRNQYNLFSCKIDSTFFKNLQVLTQDLSRPNFSSGVHESYRRYADAAYELYRVLIEPCAGLIRDKSLIIIPDGILSYLPFEALLTRPAKNDEPDYRNLPYLIRDYDIGYAYSATLHFEEQRSKARPSGSLLAFAPDYSNVFAQRIPDLSYLEAYRNQLIPIPGVKDEVKKISHLIRSDVYLDESATENNFKKHAADYDILHLAMHTIVDNDNPMYSKLAFTQNIDSVEDGFLNTYEIYNMKYNARMAVLSSCKTGYGRLQKGEGVMSLARGFMYAGCPSIIMTLWEVSDKSGVYLMEDFYRALKKGKTKTQALREAKLEFLRNADQLKANPYFWSTYVSIGDNSSLYPPHSGIVWIISATLLVIAAGTTAFWYFQIRRKRKTNEGSFHQDTIYT